MYLSNIFTVLVFSYCMCAISAQRNSVLPGVQISFAARALARAVEPICNAAKPQRQCGTDCKTLLFCDGANTLGKITCPITKPDCDTTLNTCVTKRPADQCPSLVGDYSCPGREGYFPDPKNCRLYNYCENTKVLISYTCPLGYAFDMALEQCRRGAPCGLINCFAKPAATHSVYTHLYAFCSNNLIIDGSYTQCPEKTQEFDYTEFECKSKCRKEGNIPHETDCAKYYRCLATGAWGALEKTEQSCPPGQKFNKEKLLCDKTTVCP